MTSLVEKIVGLHRSLRSADLPHGFGGALALAWCTQRARGTIDIDVNVFVTPSDAAVALGALPGEVRVTAADRRLLERDGQARLWWDETPVDVFLNTTDYHSRRRGDRGSRDRISGRRGCSSVSDETEHGS